MSDLEISILGSEVLRKKAKAVENITPELVELAEEMLESMYRAPGIGLAAPQIGKSIRLIVLDVDWKRKGRQDDEDEWDEDDEFDIDEIENANPRILFNPVITETAGDDLEYEEGCLSVPEIFGTVIRPDKVVVEATNEKGEEVLIEADGLLSRCLQHEIDHLDGVLFVDKISAAERAILTSKLRKMARKNK